MTGYEVAFLIMAAVVAVASVFVATARNVVHAALFLVTVLGGIGAIFIFLGAEFIGWVQILIYVGAIVVLILFGLMLTRAPIGRVALDNQQRGVALVVSAATFAVLTWIIWSAFGGERIELAHVTRTEDIGVALFSRFLLPFEAVGFLLLASLIGAILLARKD